MTWTNDRLSRLFTRYRLRYWRTSRRLRSYRVEVASLSDAYGECDFNGRVLVVDISKHRSDRDIRATLLHEMVHAVVGGPGHRAPFWTQLESLLARGAPITVGFPELAEAGRHLGVIPPSFRRCRRLFAPVYRRQQRAIASLPSTKVDLEEECYDAAIEGRTWKEVWAYQADRWGLVDLDGRLMPRAQRLGDACRREYQRGRRLYLETQRARLRFPHLKAKRPDTVCRAFRAAPGAGAGAGSDCPVR